jgi:hypothetical protein
MSDTDASIIAALSELTPAILSMHYNPPPAVRDAIANLNGAVAWADMRRPGTDGGGEDAAAAAAAAGA